MDPVDPLRVLDATLERGASTFAWALTYAKDGDPLPTLWSRCDDPFVMVSIAARVHRAEAARALAEASLDARTYPHGRDCLLSAARALAAGSIDSAESFVNSAIVHYPGRGTARPQPEKSYALRAAICEAPRRRVALSLDAL